MSFQVEAGAVKMEGQKADIENGIASVPEEQEEKGMCEDRTMRTAIVQGVSGASIAFNLAAMVIEAATIVYIAGIFAIILAPIVMFLQLKLQDTDTLRKIHNALRQDVNRLQEENNKLTGEVNRLEVQVGLLRDQEKRLGDIVSTQGTSVGEFVGLVKENRILIEKQKEIVRNDTAQLLTSMLINSDQNKDGTLTGLELKQFQAKLNTTPGLNIDKEKLRATLASSGGSKGALLKIIYSATHEL